MPQPSPADVHVDAVLTNISVAFMQDANNFIATKVFPTVPVEKQSDLYFVYPADAWLRDTAQRRADATESAGDGFTYSKDPYFADVYALHKDVGDQLMANYDSPLDPLGDAARFIAQKMLLRLERQFVSDFLKTGVWGTDLTGVASGPSASQFIYWSDYTNSDPIADMEAAKAKVIGKTGLEANTLTLGYSAYTKLKNHPDIIDRLKYTSRESGTTEILAELFEVERVLVAKSVINTAKEGAAKAVAFNFDKSALLTHSAQNPGLQTPTAGYTFQWTGVSDGLGATVGTSQFRMPELRAERVESQIAFDNKVVAPELGVYLNGAVT